MRATSSSILTLTLTTRFSKSALTLAQSLSYRSLIRASLASAFRFSYAALLHALLALATASPKTERVAVYDSGVRNVSIAADAISRAFASEIRTPGLAASTAGITSPVAEEKSVVVMALSLVNSVKLGAPP